MILGIPRWWGFPFAVVCLILLVITCIYTLVNSTKGVVARRST